MAQTRVAIYARVSTAEQAEEGYSIDAQIENITARCKIEGKVITGIYADRGISGKSLVNRLELLRLIEDSKQGLFDQVIVWKTSRLARNILDLLQIVKTFDENGVTFTSLTEPYDTSTNHGKLMMSMLASFAEFERTTIIENLKMGMNARAKQGLKNGGRMLGYRSEGTGKDSRLVIVAEEAVLIRRIFEMYTAGNGYKAIANCLNREGQRTIKDNLYSIQAIRDIVMNATYAGKITFNKLVDYGTKRRKGRNENFIMVDGVHEAIISMATWEKAQAIREVKADKYPRTCSGEFPLSGLMVCPVCGSAMGAARTTNTLKDGTKRRIRYYTCGSFRNKGAVACNANSVRADKAEEYVFKQIKDVLLNDKVLKDIVKKLNDTKDTEIKPLQEELKEIEAKIMKQETSKNRIFELYEDGSIDKLILNQRLQGNEDIIGNLIKRKSEILYTINRQGTDKIPFQFVKQTMTDFERLMKTSDQARRKFFLQLIIKKITVNKDRKIDTIEIHFNGAIHNVIKGFLGEDSSDDDESSFVFALAI